MQPVDSGAPEGARVGSHIVRQRPTKKRRPTTCSGRLILSEPGSANIRAHHAERTIARTSGPESFRRWTISSATASMPISSRLPALRPPHVVHRPMRGARSHREPPADRGRAVEVALTTKDSHEVVKAEKAALGLTTRVREDRFTAVAIRGAVSAERANSRTFSEPAGEQHRVPERQA
jgi:hypothetical protein